MAAGVPGDAALAARILARVDSGSCTHVGKATWVSEVYYDAANCVGGNTGDSKVTMGRIAWQDSLARQTVGTPAAAAVFDTKILAPLQADLLKRSWLPERYNCDGTDAHNSYYFEYSSVVAMMIYEVKYGISIQMTRVLVNPLTATNFDFAMGQAHIGYYNGTAFHAQLPDGHSGPRNFIVSRMQPGPYTVYNVGLPPFNTTVGTDGVLSFSVRVGKGYVVDAKHN